MNKTLNHKESTLYKQFFKENTLILILPALFLGSLAYLYQINQPVTFQATTLLEQTFNENNLSQKALLTDEIVVVLRSEARQADNFSSKFNIFKSGPVAIHLSVANYDPQKAAADLQDLLAFSANRYASQQVGGITIIPQNEPTYLLLVVAIVAGLSLGVLISLFRLYLKNH